MAAEAISTRFFGNICLQQFLQESTAVHERRHSNVTYMAKAISVRYLFQQVSKLCPDQPVPSEQWVRLQLFLPCTHAQGEKQSVCLSVVVVVVVVVVGTKIARSHVLGICACCKHNQLVDIGEKPLRIA